MTKQERLSTERNYKVVKGNDLIQKSRYHMSVKEQKAIAYICSKIKPLTEEQKNGEDPLPVEYDFSIVDYCHVCGIEQHSGQAYEDIRRTLKALRDKSIWMTLEDGSEITVSWISKVAMQPKKGIVHIILDPDILKYLYALKEKFTEYDLYEILAMKSAYSIRLFELFKSYAWQRDKTFEIEEFKHLLMIEDKSYSSNFKDLRKNVLDPALREINTYTYLQVSYQTNTEGRKVVSLTFSFKDKPVGGEHGRLMAMANVKSILEDHQELSLPKHE